MVGTLADYQRQPVHAVDRGFGVGSGQENA
jgi:hypothetical protein